MNDMLSWLLIGHLAGDYLLQTRWMATRKTIGFPALAVHSAVYACSVWLASLACLPAGGLSFLSVFLVFVSHAVIDRRNLVLWWCRHVTRSDDSAWLVIMTDQTLHIVILALVCALERSM